MRRYNTEVIRRMLSDAFNDNELTAFCFDYFFPVHEEFGPAMGRQVKIQYLIDYCYRHDRFEYLLTQVKKKNPSQFEHYHKLINKDPGQAQLVPLSSELGYAVLKVPGDLSELTTERMKALEGAIAGVLEIPRGKVMIVKTDKGSIVLTVFMPSESARKFGDLNQSLLLKELGVKELVITGNKLHMINLSRADLTRFDLRGAKLGGAYLTNAKLSGANLGSANLSRADLSGADLSVTNLEGAFLKGVSLFGAYLFGANLSSAYLTLARLNEANLTEADLTKAKLNEAYLKLVDLTRANLSWADLSGSDLNWANLNETNLTGANLMRADLWKANLSGADLTEANLSGADLTEANLNETNLTGANLSGADLTEVFNYADEQLLQAKTLAGATMPDGRKYEEWLQFRENQGAEQALVEVDNLLTENQDYEQE